MITVKPLSIDNNTGEFSESDGAKWMRQFAELCEIAQINEGAIVSATKDLSEQQQLRAFIASQGEGYILR